MSHTEQVEQMTDIMARFVGYTSKVLPDDVADKLKELASKETVPIAKLLYETYEKNMELAKKLDRPSCQDTGVLQFFVKCGTKFPLIDDLEALLREAVIRTTVTTPLRHNSVETFDEYNTGKMSVKEPLPYFGPLNQTLIPAKSIPIWQAVAAPFQVMPWS